MDDPTRRPEKGAVPDRGSTAGTPRWVKALGLVALVLLLLAVALAVSGRGGHGPGRHTGGGHGDDRPAAGGAVENAMTAVSLALDLDELTEAARR